MSEKCPKCGESLVDVTVLSNDEVMCPKCGKQSMPPDGTARRRVEDLWGESIQDVARPDVTIKRDVAGDTEATGSVAERLELREQTVMEAGGPVERPPHYEILQQLGRGGMGIVYQARQTSVDRTIALKMMRTEFAGQRRHRNMFLSEAVATADLDHPNIVPIHDVGSDDKGVVFYAMKEVRGTSWKRVIKDKTQAENIEILMRVADAIAFAHSKAVIHRDLKPENVMLGDFGEVLVMDWGLAVSISDEGKADRLGPEHAVGGTPAYMAPEMANGDVGNIGPQSDVYLLGALLFEIVTGTQPHPGKDAMECLVSASKNEIVAADARGELVNVARQAMATELSERHLTVKKFQAAVKEVLAHEESLTLVATGTEHLKDAADSSDYGDYARAVFAFEEALRLWEGNKDAREGLSNALCVYAKHALRKGDLDLSASLLDPADRSHAELLPRIEEEKRTRLVRRRRIKTLTYASVVLTALVLVGSFVAFYFVNEARKRAENKENVAVAREAQASALKNHLLRANFELNRTLGEAKVLFAAGLLRGDFGPGKILVFDDSAKGKELPGKYAAYVLTPEKRTELVAGGSEYCLEFEGAMKGFYMFIDKPVVRLGRLREHSNDFYLPDMTVSREHLVFHWEAPDLYVTCLGINGAVINSARIPQSGSAERKLLQAGNTIAIGRYTSFTVRRTRDLVVEAP
ncbi:protein kinase [Verrucomicrobiota bacterium]